jgi:hypothetical protein
LQASVSWWNGLDGATLVAGDVPSTAPRLTFALGEEVVGGTKAANVTRDGRTFTVIEIERTYLPTQAGTLTVPAPSLRFAYATRFEEDVVNDRIATDARDAEVNGAALRLDVKPLPEAGRPAGFTGAVGRFEAAAETDRRAAAPGESVRLTLRIEGDGNLASFPAPSLGRTPNLHVRGRLDRTEGRVRTIVYDLAPHAVLETTLPSIVFAYFDPEAGEYHTIRTQAIPLDVTAAEEIPSAREIQPRELHQRRPDSLWTRVLAFSIAAILVVLVMIRRRARAVRAPDPAAERVAAARSALAAAPTGDALAEYLGARLGCPAAAVIGPELSAKLVATGVPEDLARRASSILERLVAARYGGGASAEDAAAARAVAEEIEKHYAPRGSSR